MTSYTWHTARGNWNNVNDWNPLGTPGSTDKATVSGTSTTQLFITAADSIFDFTLSDPNAATDMYNSGSSLRVGDQLKLESGVFNVSYVDSPGGVLTLNPNSTTTITGGTLNINVGGQANVAGSWDQVGGTVNLNGGSLTDNSSTNNPFKLEGGILNVSNITARSGVLTITSDSGQITGGGLNINQGGTVNIDGSLTQTGGTVYLGAGGALNIGGVWNLASDVGIGGSAAAPINIGYDLEKTGGTGTSKVAGHVDCRGEVVVDVGTLEFRSSVDGVGDAALNNHSTLQFDKGVNIADTLFQGSNETLSLLQPQNFHSFIENFDGFGTNDVIKLAGFWSFDSISYDQFGDTHLKVKHDATVASFEFGSTLNLHVHPGATTTITA